MALRWAGLVTVAMTGPRAGGVGRAPVDGDRLGAVPPGVGGEDDLGGLGPGRAAVVDTAGSCAQDIQPDDPVGVGLRVSHLVVIFFERRPELDAGAAGDVAVAELRVLGAAERERLARHRHADVDADHAAGGALADVAGHRAAGGEHAGGVAVGAGRLEGQRLVQVGHAHDGQHRAEQLAARALHVGAGAVDDGGPEPVAALVARRAARRRRPSSTQLGALRLGAVDGGAQAVAGGRVDDGAHARAQLDVGRARRRSCSTRCSTGADREQHARGHAALAGAAGERVDHARAR